MPTSDDWQQYRKWSQEFKSDIIYLNVFGTQMVVTNTLKSTLDLLERRSSKYSSRPRMTMLAELMGYDWSFALLPYGDEWRAHRRLAAIEFDARTIPKFNPAFTRNAHGLLRRLLESPEAWNQHIRHQVGAMIIEVSYGFEALPENDPFIDTAEKGVHSVAIAGKPGAFLVDTVPALKYVPSWFPGAGFKRKAKQWKRYSDDMLEAPFKALKEDIANGVAKPSFAQRCLQNMDPNIDIAHQEKAIKGVSASMYGAGSDTSVTFLATFVLAMVQYPAVQQRAQAELDRVLGPDRLPTFDDMSALPYLSAIIKECHRWEVVFPFAIPHMLTEDDEYKGWHLPSGTLVIPNSWAILNDPAVYPDPSVFNPERFLKDGKIDPDAQDPEMVVFGYGRRICPGSRVANAFVWLSAGCMLASFNIRKAIGSDGMPIEPTGNYVAGLLRQPDTFECAFIPRSEDTRDMIRSTDA
ncbi:cytochrome P450 [Athelia psychrophila]|uniref:Cytochrome P450 n=1 Tax=Athelia psychrophila TaxID=1759441 RepID=A0A166LT27_9AGAM|nr:cytochrome P450 [Fibularhizoctonia sp. CBS 109695]